MSSRDPKSDLTRIERLAALLHDDGAEADAMSKEQLAQYLKDNKVDMAAPQKRFDAILKKATARRRLEVAHQRRLEAVKSANNLVSIGTEAVSAVRERVQTMIEKFKQNDPEQAQIYAREFEKATTEDLIVLEEDLKLLEMNQPENGKSD